jgi:hypothetical protein
LNGRTSDSAEVEINGVVYLVYAGGIVIDVFERLLRKGAKHQAKTYLFERASSYSKLEVKK